MITMAEREAAMAVLADAARDGITPESLMREGDRYKGIAKRADLQPGLRAWINEMARHCRRLARCLDDLRLDAAGD
jgi:hypothetical protein